MIASSEDEESDSEGNPVPKEPQPKPQAVDVGVHSVTIAEPEVARESDSVVPLNIVMQDGTETSDRPVEHVEPKSRTLPVRGLLSMLERSDDDTEDGDNVVVTKRRSVKQSLGKGSRTTESNITVINRVAKNRGRRKQKGSANFKSPKTRESVRK